MGVDKEMTSERVSPPEPSETVNKIIFTERARQMVLSFITDDDADDEALRITVSGQPAAPNFDLSLVPRAERTEHETEIEQDGFTVLVRTEDVALLDGSTVDYVERLNESGFEVRPATQAGTADPARTREEPSGEIADRVRSVLESQVNPAIAAHGGLISLVEVKETDVYVQMSGGCQGCALSSATLRQGVERMLREAVPELTAVHDVTDHASGDNPYL